MGRHEGGRLIFDQLRYVFTKFTYIVIKTIIYLFCADGQVLDHCSQRVNESILRTVALYTRFESYCPTPTCDGTAHLIDFGVTDRTTGDLHWCCHPCGMLGVGRVLRCVKCQNDFCPACGSWKSQADGYFHFRYLAEGVMKHADPAPEGVTYLVERHQLDGRRIVLDAALTPRDAEFQACVAVPDGASVEGIATMASYINLLRMMQRTLLLSCLQPSTSPDGVANHGPLLTNFLAMLAARCEKTIAVAVTAVTESPALQHSLVNILRASFVPVLVHEVTTVALVAHDEGRGFENVDITPLHGVLRGFGQFVACIDSDFLLEDQDLALTREARLFAGCTVVSSVYVESAHPCAPGHGTPVEVDLAGADFLHVTFDSRCCLDAMHGNFLEVGAGGRSDPVARFYGAYAALPLHWLPLTVRGSGKAWFRVGGMSDSDDAWGWGAMVTGYSFNGPHTAFQLDLTRTIESVHPYLDNTSSSLTLDVNANLIVIDFNEKCHTETDHDQVLP